MKTKRPGRPLLGKQKKERKSFRIEPSKLSKAIKKYGSIQQFIERAVLELLK
jgi:hypothetical protein